MKSPFIETRSSTIEEAESVCAAQGYTAQACIDAWALAEDLEAEAAYQEGVEPKEKTAFQEYCDKHPEILQVRHKILASTASNHL